VLPDPLTVADERAMTEVMDGLRIHWFRTALPTKPVAPVMMTFMVMGWA